jgi:hypothetical protein
MHGTRMLPEGSLCKYQGIYSGACITHEIQPIFDCGWCMAQPADATSSSKEKHPAFKSAGRNSPYPISPFYPLAESGQQ